MKTDRILRTLVILGAVLWLLPLTGKPGSAQTLPPTPPQEMPDFTLPVFQGGEVTLSQLRGKNVLLIFPRGLASEGSWCHICHYQYAELAALDASDHIREKFGLEILFVLPYGREMVEEWVKKFPAQLEDIERYKNPPDPDKLDDRGRRRLELMQKAFPKNFTSKEEDIALPFPVLIDAERTVSKQLGLFTTEWGGSRVDQNVPAVYVIDKDGILRFKYFSQNTFDRPGFDYLKQFLTR